MSIYHGKTMLAPMVRVNSVGLRVYCAAQGADVVFSEEVVAAKLERCRREVRLHSDVAGPMVEFVAYEPFRNGYKRSVAFATPLRPGGGEGAPVVLQLGVAAPSAGAAAAVLCCEDVDGIDVNMGCPKKFSVSNGMGAALMQDTPRAAAILLAIDGAVNAPDKLTARGRRVPLSFKIRLLETAEATAEMIISIIEKVGPGRIHAITLHARTVDQKSETPPHYSQAAETVKRLRENPLFKDMCFVLNGSVRSRKDGASKMAQFGFDAVMIARHAMWDMSVFSRHPPPSPPSPCSPPSEEGCNVLGSEDDEVPLASSSWMHLYRGLLWSHVRYGTLFAHTKYHLTRSIPCIRAMKHLMATVQQKANNYEDLARIFGFAVEEQGSIRDIATVEIVPSIPTIESEFGDVVSTTASDAANDEHRRRDDSAAAPVAKKLREE